MRPTTKRLIVVSKSDRWLIAKRSYGRVRKKSKDKEQPRRRRANRQNGFRGFRLLRQQRPKREQRPFQRTTDELEPGRQPAQVERRPRKCFLAAPSRLRQRPPLSMPSRSNSLPWASPAAIWSSHPLIQDQDSTSGHLSTPSFRHTDPRRANRSPSGRHASNDGSSGGTDNRYGDHDAKEHELGPASPDAVGDTKNHGQPDRPGSGERNPGPSPSEHRTTRPHDEQSYQDDMTPKDRISSCNQTTKDQTKDPGAIRWPTPGVGPLTVLRVTPHNLTRRGPRHVLAT